MSSSDRVYSERHEIRLGLRELDLVVARRVDEEPQSGGALVLEQDPIVISEQSDSDYSHYDDSAREDEIIVRKPYAEKLKEIVLESNFSKAEIEKLLKIAHEEGIDVPLSAEVFLGTPKNKIVTVPVSDGQYLHLGIEKGLSNSNHDFLFDVNNTEVVLDFGIDGVSLGKSSANTLWPILAAFPYKKKIPPFLVGCYLGAEQPQNLFEFLNPLVSEIDKLQRDGVLVTKLGIRKSFRVRCFICDTPAKSFISGTKYQTSYNGCHYCE